MLSIRPGTEADFPVLFSMIQELALFEKSPDSVKNSLEMMRNESTYFRFFLAEEDDGVIGFALYFFAYYTWNGKSLYLDDLYVKPEHRGKGAGKILFKKMLDVAKEEKCHQVRWQVLDWNTEAIRFYERLGAEIKTDWFNGMISIS